ncbi:MAG: acyl-CoA thioesterase [Planctomycetota bacterium]
MLQVPFTVRSYELDSLGHLNNAVYFSWLEDASFVFLADHGLPFRAFAELGWYPIVAHARVDYRREILSGDRIVVRGWPLRYGTTSMRLGYRFEREPDGEVVAEAERVWVFVKTGSGKIPVPEVIRRAFGPARSTDGDPPPA